MRRCVLGGYGHVYYTNGFLSGAILPWSTGYVDKCRGTVVTTKEIKICFQVCQSYLYVGGLMTFDF